MKTFLRKIPRRFNAQNSGPTPMEIDFYPGILAAPNLSGQRSNQCQQEVPMEVDLQTEERMEEAMAEEFEAMEVAWYPAFTPLCSSKGQVDLIQTTMEVDCEPKIRKGQKGKEKMGAGSLHLKGVRLDRAAKRKASWKASAHLRKVAKLASKS